MERIGDITPPSIPASACSVFVSSRPPDISVVIPTFKRPQQLAEALKSVIAQSNVDVEIIVVDDCSNRSAADVVKRIGSTNIRYVHNSKPTGGRPAVVRNLGWPLATGELIHFLDDDDIVPAGYYARVTAAFKSNPGIGVAFGRVEPFGDGEVGLHGETEYFRKSYRRARVLRYLGNWIGYSAWLRFSNTFLVCSSAIVRRSIVAELRGFDEDILLCEDVDFFARAIRGHGAIMLNEVSIRYRIGPSLMHNSDIKDKKLSDSYRTMHSRYKTERGLAEFVVMKSVAVALRVVPC